MYSFFLFCAYMHMRRMGHECVQYLKNSLRESILSSHRVESDSQTLFVTPGHSCLDPLIYLGTLKFTM